MGIAIEGERETVAIFPARTDPHCPICKGVIECKGGGNIYCRKRNPQDAQIAIILDTYGGTRTVVADQYSMQANVRHDELAYVVPNLLVHEPIAWNDIPFVIERARIELEKWLDTRPNLNKVQHQIIMMYRLRCLEHANSHRSLDLNAIAET